MTHYGIDQHTIFLILFSNSRKYDSLIYGFKKKTPIYTNHVYFATYLIAYKAIPKNQYIIHPTFFWVIFQKKINNKNNNNFTKHTYQSQNEILEVGYRRQIKQ